MAAVFLTGAGLALRAEFLENGHVWGFPLDDSWIHMALGRNLAEGSGFGINPGVPVNVSTSLPWTLWIALLHVLFKPLGLKALVLAVKGCGILLTLWAVWASIRIFRRFVPEAVPVFLGALVAWSAFPVVWGALSGMEVPLTIGVCLWATVFSIESFLGERSGALLPPLFWGGAVLCRPENGLFLLVAAVSSGWQSGRAGFSPKRAFMFLGVAGLVIVSGMVVEVGLAGHPLPGTFTAKMTERAIPRVITEAGLATLPGAMVSSAAKDVSETAWFVFGENPLSPLILLGPLLVVIFWPGSLPIGLGKTLGWGGAGVFLYSVAVGWVAGPESLILFHGRYLAAPVLLSSIFGVGAFLAGWASNGRPNWVLIPVFISALFVFDRQASLIDDFGKEVKNINDLQVSLGRWMGESLSPSLVVATHDIGAFSYFGRQKIIDVEGLATPEAVPWRRGGKVDKFLELVKPDLLVIFPYWYPEIVARPEAFKPVMQRSVQRNLTGGGDSLVLFLMPWRSNLPAVWPPFQVSGFPEKIPTRLPP